MKELEITNLLTNGKFWNGLDVGLTKFEIQNRLGRPLGKQVIETPDADYFLVSTINGCILSLTFDKEGICFEINFSFEENKGLGLVVEVEGSSYSIQESVSFESLLVVLLKLKIEWEFDRKRIYLQTVCIKLASGIRLYYAFGDQQKSDYGLFSIKSVLEDHLLVI